MQLNKYKRYDITEFVYCDGLIEYTRCNIQELHNP